MNRHRLAGSVAAAAIIATGLAVAPAGKAVAAPARPVPPPVKVAITASGYTPSSVTLAVGQTVEFANDTTTTETVTADDGTFDSGPIPAGGGYSMALGGTGAFTFHSNDDATLNGLVTVADLELPGAPTDNAVHDLPKILIPPVTDLDTTPDGVSASRSRIVVMLQPNATVAATDAAFANANVEVAGTIPDIGALLVQLVTEPQPGDFGPVNTALASLRSDPSILAATMDKQDTTSIVPAPSADATVPFNWDWVDRRQLNDDPTALQAGGNWGLKAARFPEAWNMLDKVRLEHASVQTVDQDGGFDSKHPDLQIATPQLCQLVIAFCSGNSSADNVLHGTHTAGTIGATWDNPSGAGKTLGISGANPVANLSGVGWGGLALTTTFPSVTPAYTTANNYALWNEIIDEKQPGGQFPNLRVVNYSAGSVFFARDKNTNLMSWGTLMAGKHCGPGLGDDAGATGPCTPNTDDTFLADIAGDGAIARAVAARAANANITIAAAAGNESDSICENATTTVQPNVVAGPNGQGVTVCPNGFHMAILDARNMTAFGWADAHWTNADPNPIIMVEAVGKDLKRASFSNIGGEVSAPGVDIVSTVPGGTYKAEDGTSMAAPHVTGLVGYLLADDPQLTEGQVRDDVIQGADITSGDATDLAKPMIDAYSSLLLVPGALHDLADWNDQSLDGDRRVIRSRDNVETPDTVLGGQLSNANGEIVHSAPDGKVDMRDFRRFRDALLQVCVAEVRGGACPPANSIALDGADSSPKKDLNFDGCVAPSAGGCFAEEGFSRFDLNGDGFVSPDAVAPTTNTNPTVVGKTDLQLFQSVFDEGSPGAQGWNRADLPGLLRSGDLEIHADTMFARGAKNVSVEVDDGNGNPIPTTSIDSPGGADVVTVPTANSGSQITVVGHATVDGKPLDSDPELVDLKTGSDARVDLCVPTLTISAPHSMIADGESQASVNATITKCDDTQAPLSNQQIEFSVKHAGDNNTPSSSLAEATATTDANGHTTVKFVAGNTSENDQLDATATIGTGPTAQTITGTAAVDVTEPPHLIYRWEQSTIAWNATGHFHRDPEPFFNDPGADITSTYTGIPSTVSRAGTLTPIGTTDAHIVEDVPADEIQANQVNVDTLGSNSGSGPFSISVPVIERHTDMKVSQGITNFWLPGGLAQPQDKWEFGKTSFTTSDSKIAVHNFNDVGSAVGYPYSYDPNTDCSGVNGPICSQEFEMDQLALVQREAGSAIEYGPDLTKDLTFGKLPDGSWSTYNYCGPVETNNFRGGTETPLSQGLTGSATIQTRFVAKIVTDNTDPSTLQFGDCTDQKPPIAAISRAPITANEGQLVHFVDASSDPNGDIVSWQWDFGDGTTSTDQFPDHTYTDNGTYTVKLTVTDAAGNSDSTTVDEDVTNVAPTIVVQDATVDTGTAAGVSFSAFDPGSRDAESLTLAITSDDPTVPKFPPVQLPAGSGTINIGILPDGSHSFTATITDKDGASGTASFTVNTGDLTTGTVEPQDDIEVEPAPICNYGVKLDLGESDLLDQLSQYRLANGLSPVYASPTLTTAAETQVDYLKSNDLFTHTGSGNSSPFDRAKTAGYPGTLVGENLVRGAANAPAAMIAWKLSPAHNANLLNTHWNAVGIAQRANRAARMGMGARLRRHRRLPGAAARPESRERQPAAGRHHAAEPAHRRAGLEQHQERGSAAERDAAVEPERARHRVHRVEREARCRRGRDRYQPIERDGNVRSRRRKTDATDRARALAHDELWRPRARDREHRARAVARRARRHRRRRRVATDRHQRRPDGWRPTRNHHTRRARRERRARARHRAHRPVYGRQPDRRRRDRCKRPRDRADHTRSLSRSVLAADRRARAPRRRHRRDDGRRVHGRRERPAAGPHVGTVRRVVRQSRHVRRGDVDRSGRSSAHGDLGPEQRRHVRRRDGTLDRTQQQRRRAEDLRRYL